VDWWLSVNIVTSSIVRSILSNTEADFEVFRPAGVARCSDGGEIVN